MASERPDALSNQDRQVIESLEEAKQLYEHYQKINDLCYSPLLIKNLSPLNRRGLRL